MKFKDSENIQRLLMEMPRWSKAIEDNTFDDLAKRPIDDLRSMTKEISKNGVFEIRRAANEENTILFFIIDNVFVVGYTFKPYSNYIKTVNSWRNPNFRSSFYQIFTEWILPRFNRIESDNRLTDMGYDFWKKLVSQHPELYFYVRTIDEYLPIVDVTDMDKYYGKSVEFSNYAFVVSKNPI